MNLEGVGVQEIPGVSSAMERYRCSWLGHGKNHTPKNKRKNLTYHGEPSNTKTTIARLYLHIGIGTIGGDRVATLHVQFFGVRIRHEIEIDTNGN